MDAFQRQTLSRFKRARKQLEENPTDLERTQEYQSALVDLLHLCDAADRETEYKVRMGKIRKGEAL